MTVKLLMAKMLTGGHKTPIGFQASDQLQNSWKGSSGFIHLEALGHSLMPGMRAARACLSWSLLPDLASWSAAGPVSCIVKLVGCPCISAFLHSEPLRHGPSEEREQAPGRQEHHNTLQGTP